LKVQCYKYSGSVVLSCTVTSQEFEVSITRNLENMKINSSDRSVYNNIKI